MMPGFLGCFFCFAYIVAVVIHFEPALFFQPPAAAGAAAGWTKLHDKFILTGGKTMFKKQFVVLFIILAFKLTLGADLLLKAGANYSWFANEGGTSETKPAIGIGLQFPLDKTSQLKLAIDALYVEQRTVLKNKTRPASLFPIDECEIISGNLYLHYVQLKIPIFLNFPVYYDANFSAAFHVGYSINFTIGNKSSTDQYIVSTESCKYDYERVDEDQGPEFPNEILLGADMYYRRIGLNLSYTYTLTQTRWLLGLRIQDHIHSIRMMLTWKLNAPHRKS